MQLQNEDINATLKTADELWAAYREKRNDATFIKKNVTEKIGHFQSLGYSDFITKYAVPTRYMVMYDEYSHNAFHKYLIRLKTVGYKSKDEWIERQADYVKLLWRAYNPRGSTKDAAEAHRGAYESIKTEMEGFENDYDKAKVKAEDRRLTAISDNRQALIALLADRESSARIERVQSRYKPVDIPVQAPAPVETTVAAPVVAEAVPAKVLNETQRRNAARRQREKIKRALAAAQAINRQNNNSVNNERREARRKQNALDKVRLHEAEKDSMRKKGEETRAKLTASQEDEDDVELPDDSDILELSD